jgi:hypothetical protein
MAGHEGFDGSQVVIAFPYFGVLEYWSAGKSEMLNFNSNKSLSLLHYSTTLSEA